MRQNAVGPGFSLVAGHEERRSDRRPAAHRRVLITQPSREPGRGLRTGRHRPVLQRCSQGAAMRGNPFINHAMFIGTSLFRRQLTLLCPGARTEVRARISLTVKLLAFVFEGSVGGNHAVHWTRAGLSTFWAGWPGLLRPLRSFIFRSLQFRFTGFATHCRS